MLEEAGFQAFSAKSSSPVSTITESMEVGRAGWPYVVTKHMMDLLAVLLLGVPFLLILPVLTLAIALDSPGSVFYRQTRVGRHGRPFQIYKLRTMCADAERHGAKWALEVDPRATRVGRWLRKSRLDEFPQLLNILRGDMTLIGPRPERPEFTALLETNLPRYNERHAVTPGLTGWAQVNYSYTNSVDGSRIKLSYDLYYVTHASFALDARILWRTLLVIMGCRGW